MYFLEERNNKFLLFYFIFLFFLFSVYNFFYVYSLQAVCESVLEDIVDESVQHNKQFWTVFYQKSFILIPSYCLKNKQEKIIMAEKYVFEKYFRNFHKNFQEFKKSFGKQKKKSLNLCLCVFSEV